MTVHADRVVEAMEAFREMYEGLSDDEFVTVMHDQLARLYDLLPEVTDKWAFVGAVAQEIGVPKMAVLFWIRSAQ